MTTGELQVHDPREFGMDPGRLARIDQFVADRYLATDRYAHYGLVVSRRGRVVHASFQGHAREEPEAVPFGPDSLVRIYSMTKPITSVALLTLHEEGRFKLDDPLSDHLPAFANPRIWLDGSAANPVTRGAEREITVRDLLTHTSGLTYGFMQRHPVDQLYRQHRIDFSANDLASWVETLAELPLLFTPGTQWSYSVATDVCGHLIEVLSGLPLDRFLTDRIFEPLGMTDTGFWVDDLDADRLSDNWAVPALSPFPVPDGAQGAARVLIDRGADSRVFGSKPTFLSGGGGLVSSIGDYHRFARMLLNGGELDGVRILGRKTVEYATSNHLPGGHDLAAMGQPVFSEARFEGVGFGLGFSVVTDPAATQVLCSRGEFAWGGAASTLFWVDPTEEVVVVGLSQLMPSSAYPIRTELRTMVNAALVD